jgi:enediyne biosynthesis thioesterase
MSLADVDRRAARPAGLAARPKAFVYRHIVCFEETNLVGNVYFVRHLAWQGRCREMFLQEYAPSVVAELSQDLRLVTIHASCDYYAELFAFDEIELRMRLADRQQNRIGLAFEYYRRKDGDAALVARGAQEIGCMRQNDGGLRPVPVPADLAVALAGYGDHG